MTGASEPIGADAPGGMAPVCAANPLPIARRGLVHLPLAALGDVRAVIDATGARHPAQRDGELLAIGLPLQALESRALAAHPTPVAGSLWEVAATVLDNGRVRVELDDHGRIARWCVDGAFAPLAEPIGVVGWRPDAIVVEAAGPVFARIAAVGGGLRVAYELRAHADELLVDAGGASLRLALRGIESVLAGDGGRGAPARAATRARWAVLRRGDGAAIATLAGATSFIIEGDDGTASVDGRGRIALALPGRRRPAPLMAAQALAAPFVAATAAAAPPWRLLDTGSLAFAEPAIASSSSERGALALVETLGGAGRAWLFADGIARAWRVDRDGAELGELPLSPERDAIQLDYAAGDVLLVRWR